LKEEKDVYRYGDITKIYEALGIYTDEYIKKRNALGITTHAIMPFYETERAQIKKKRQGTPRCALHSKKTLPYRGRSAHFRK